MVIVRFQGGIGNQLFQYALYRKLLYLGKETYADLNTFQNKKEPREYELGRLGLSVKEAPLDVISRIYPRGENFFSKIARNTFYRKGCIKEKKPQTYDPIFLNCDNVFLSGYWQTEKYFEDISGDIYRDIKFCPVNEDDNRAILKRIKCSNSVSVHVRMGDYVNNPLYDGICTGDYYRKAIRVMRDRVKEAFFFVISDDIPGARTLLGDEGMEYIGVNKGEASYYDMYLISQCKHHIMANSSFSWWGNWLDQSEDKIVVSPSVWEKGAVSEDIWGKSWIRISPEGKMVCQEG